MKWWKLIRLLGLALLLATLAAAAQRGERRPRFEPLDDPKFVPAARADFLQDGDRVLGVSGNGVAKAYPIAVVFWHHVVHDQLGDPSTSLGAGLPIIPTW